jgi:thiol-disulfide isomerase/thioredoxin
MEKMKKKKSIKREIIEWGLFLGIIGFLFGTGLHTPVFGFLQGLVLKTGIMQPSINENSTDVAEYDFILIDQEGKQKPFKDYENKVVFVNFWATWCPPCIAEMPDINDLYTEMSDKDIEFVLISVDDEFQKAKDFVKKKGFDFPIFQLASPLPQVYESSSIPTTYVISPDGKIVVSKSGMAKYNTRKFKQFLEELKL